MVQKVQVNLWSTKGANPDQVEILHNGVYRYVDLIYTSNRSGSFVCTGAGAAGGLQPHYMLFSSSPFV